MAHSTAERPNVGHPSYLILGREVRLPVEVRDASATIGSYLVSAGAAQRLIDGSGLPIASVLPGRTICNIGTIEYRDCDLGQYREVSVSFFVREGRLALPFAGALLGMARATLPSFIYQLPVDGEFTCEAGQVIWGFPKFMAEIDVEQRGKRRRSILRADGHHVLTQVVATAGRRSLPMREQISYAYRGQALYRIPASMGGEGAGIRLGGATLELGNHPIASELRSLGFPRRALFSVSISKMRGEFFAAETRTGR